MDVLRHLADQPVTARPPGSLYQLGKLVARNRLLVGSLTVIAVFLITGVAVLSVSFTREQAARQQAERDKRTALAEAEKSQEVSTFLREMLAGASPLVAMGRDTAVLREILDRTDRRLSSGLTRQPAVEAEVRFTLGAVYENIGDYDSSARMMRRALELQQQFAPSNHQEIATLLNHLGLALLQQDKLEEADRQLEAALELWRQMNALEDREAMSTLENLGALRIRQQRLDEAETMMRQVYSLRLKNLPPDHQDITKAVGNLASVLYAAERFPEAEPLFRETLATEQRRYGNEHPSVATGYQNLGMVLKRQGKNEEAADNLSRAVTMRRKLLEPGHPRRTASMVSLASLHRTTGNLAAAELLYRDVVKEARQQPDDYNPTVTEALGNLVSMMLAQGKTSEIDTLFAGILTPPFSSSPKSEPVWKEQVNFLARAGRWHEAATSAAQLVSMDPGEHEFYHTLGPLLVADGKVEAYRSLCAEIVTRFAGTADLFIADRMAKDCLIRPGAVLDLAPVAAMADVALKEGASSPSLPYFQLCKALATYRQGQFAAAVEWAEKVDDSLPHAGVEALAVRAMACHALGRQQEARAFLTQSISAFEAKLPRLSEGDIGESWQDWIIARELQQEACALIGESEPTSPHDETLR